MGDADLISELPTDLLVSILYRLTLKEAIATSVLSRHWEKLWKFYHGSLDFIFPRRLHEVGCSRYAKRFNKILDTFDRVEGGVFDSFTVYFHSCPTILDSVGKCVQFAMEKRRVKMLVMSSYPSSDGCNNHGGSYDFPSLEYFYAQPRNIQTLTYIHFAGVNVSSEVIEHFLSYCPDLQSLELFGLKSLLFHLRVSGETLALKYLLICDCPYLTTIEISAPNLVSFHYRSDQTNVKFYVRNVPKLVEPSIDIWNSSMKRILSIGPIALHLLSCFSHVQKFVLLCSKELEDDTKFIEFTSVKHLILIYSSRYHTRIFAWTPLLKAFPFLQKFTLDMDRRYGRSYDGVVRDHDKFPSKCLKKFEFLGFGRSNDSKLVMYLLKNTVRLEKIILGCGGSISPGMDIPMDCVEAANLAAELKQMIPGEVNLRFIGCRRDL